MSIKNLYTEDAIKMLKHEKALDILKDFCMHLQTDDFWYNYDDVDAKSQDVKVKEINDNLYPKLESQTAKFGVNKKNISVMWRAAITGTTIGFDLWSTMSLMGRGQVINNITYALVTHCGLIDPTAYWEDTYLRD